MYRVVSIVSALIVLAIGAAEDIKYKKINIILPCFVSAEAILLNVLYNNYSLPGLLADISLGIGMILYSAISRGKIGWGDGVVLCMIGVVSGINIAVSAMALASICSFIYMLQGVIRKKKRMVDAEVSFVPFVAVCYIINILI